jgi:hypothetical protein
MPKTIWRHPIKPDKIITKCEQLGICQCDKDNVKCGLKIMEVVNRKDNRKKYKMGVRVL